MFDSGLIGEGILHVASWARQRLLQPDAIMVSPCIPVPLLLLVVLVITSAVDENPDVNIRNTKCFVSEFLEVNTTAIIFSTRENIRNILFFLGFLISFPSFVPPKWGLVHSPGNNCNVIVA